MVRGPVRHGKNILQDQMIGLYPYYIIHVLGYPIKIPYQDKQASHSTAIQSVLVFILIK